MSEDRKSSIESAQLEEKIEKLVKACDTKLRRLSELEEEEKSLDVEIEVLLANTPKMSTLYKEEYEVAELKLKNQLLVEEQEETETEIRDLKGALLCAVLKREVKQERLSAIEKHYSDMWVRTVSGVALLKYHGQLLLESQSEADERAQMSVEEAISLQCDIETLKDHISFAEAEEKQTSDRFETHEAFQYHTHNSWGTTK